MAERTNQERENEIYIQYQTIICGFISELEARDEEYPIEIFNEIRAIFTHLSRYKIQQSEQDLLSAEGHVKRAILDCYKYMCVSIAEEIKQFRTEYRKVDLSIAADGNFLPALDKMEYIAKSSFIKARKEETRKEISDDDLYCLYEDAYNNYQTLINYLEDQGEAVAFASSRSKRSNIINFVTIGITAVSIIVAIISFLV